jgi:uncharacterized protein (DUF4415 family)
MKDEVDFANGRRGQAVPATGKTRVTMYLDEKIVEAFKTESARTGVGYQTLINSVLAQHVGLAEKPMTADQVRRIVREELEHAR